MPNLPRGIDVSNNNGFIDWNQVATAGLSFVIMKADQGDFFDDAHFPRNWREARRIGLARGAYHFADPEQSGPEASADHFISAVNTVGLETGDLLALDLELGHPGLADWAMTFLEIVEGHFGFKPLVYSSPSFIGDQNLAARSELGQYGLWLASWGVPTPPPAPAPWDIVAFHQYSDSGRVPGISGFVDLNRFNGRADRIALYGKPGTEAVAVAVAMEPETDSHKADRLINALAYVCDDIGDKVAIVAPAQAAEMRRVRVEQLGARP